MHLVIVLALKIIIYWNRSFGVGSLAAAFSPTAYALIASRAVLGLGAAMLIPATLSGIRNAFTEENREILHLVFGLQ